VAWPPPPQERLNHPKGRALPPSIARRGITIAGSCSNESKSRRDARKAASHERNHGDTAIAELRERNENEASSVVCCDSSQEGGHDGGDNARGTPEWPLMKSSRDRAEPGRRPVREVADLSPNYHAWCRPADKETGVVAAK